MSGDEAVARLVEAVRHYVDDALDSVHRRIDELPQPERGEKGEPGADGRDGIDGAPGEAGRDGADGANGIEGTPGEKGDPGRSGIGLAGAMIGRDGQLLVTLSNGDLLDLGRVNGHDGLGFDDLAVDYDGERTFVFRLAQGERVKEFPFQVPVMIYRGVFRTQAYERGDTVTFGGSLWVCNAATEEKPDDGIEGWTRAVRRGRDGKNGKDGEKGNAGPVGRAGRDLTQMAADGSKW